MAHHGETPFNYSMDPEEFKASNESAFNDKGDLHHHLGQVNQTPGMGATNKFPQGKLQVDDDGELGFAVAVFESKVIMSFGNKPVSWIGLDKEQAKNLAELILKKVAVLSV